jgi:hypothetical protein
MSNNFALSIDSSIIDAEQQSFINANNKYIFRNILIAKSATPVRYDLVTDRSSNEKIKFPDPILEEHGNQVNYFNSLSNGVLPIQISRGLNQDTYLGPHPNLPILSGIFSLQFEDFNDSIYFTNQMIDNVIDATDKWNAVIKGVPGADKTRKIPVDVNFKDFGNTGTLASAGPRDKEIDQELENYYFYTKTGEVSFATSFYENFWNDSESIQMRETTKHELGHILGIGNYWSTTVQFPNYKSGIILKDQEDRDGNFHNLYRGPKALDVYNFYNSNNQTLKINGIETNYKNTNYPNVTQCPGIPIEDNGGSGTASGHLEEGVATHIGSHNSIFINDIHYPGFGVELMTGITSGEETPLSALTVALVEDLGYSVNYSNAEAYELGVGAGITNNEPLIQEKTITALPFSEIGSTLGLASSFNEDGNTARDFIYRYTATQDENIKVTTCSENTLFDTRLDFKEANSTLAPRDDDVECQHNSTHSTREGLALTPNMEYQIIVSGKTAEDYGQYEISITLNHSG